MKLIIINGPNLNLLEVREPSVYGNQSFSDYHKILLENFPAIEVSYFQSNVEGETINKLHEVGFSMDGIILNAGKCKGNISRFGLDSYRLAIESVNSK